MPIADLLSAIDLLTKSLDLISKLPAKKKQFFKDNIEHNHLVLEPVLKSYLGTLYEARRLITRAKSARDLQAMINNLMAYRDTIVFSREAARGALVALLSSSPALLERISVIRIGKQQKSETDVADFLTLYIDEVKLFFVGAGYIYDNDEVKSRISSFCGDAEKLISRLLRKDISIEESKSALLDELDSHINYLERSVGKIFQHYQHLRQRCLG